MNTAILVVSSASLVCSAASMLILLKAASELNNTKKDMDAKVSDLKVKMSNNARVVRNALNSLEF